MNYKAGDEVICIDSKPILDSGYAILKAGAFYKVLAIGRKPCCGRTVVDVGAESPTGTTKCAECGSSWLGTWNYPWRFIKLEPPAIKARTEPALVEAK